jgi:cell division protein FtsB
VIRRVVTAAAILGALYFLLFGGQYTFLDLWRLDRQRETEEAALETIREEVADLERKADSLATDSAALERLAREQYGLIREGERLYRFVEADSADAVGEEGQDDRPRREPERE